MDCAKCEKLKLERRSLKIEIRRLNRELINFRSQNAQANRPGFFDKMIVCSGEPFPEDPGDSKGEG